MALIKSFYTLNKKHYQRHTYECISLACRSQREIGNTAWNIHAKGEIITVGVSQTNVTKLLYCYLRQRGYLWPGVCLSVFLSSLLATSRRSYWWDLCARKNWLNVGSDAQLDHGLSVSPRVTCNLMSIMSLLKDDWANQSLIDTRLLWLCRWSEQCFVSITVTLNYVGTVRSCSTSFTGRLPVCLSVFSVSNFT